MSERPINLDTTERLISGIGGGLLVLKGVRRFSLGGLLMAGAGALLIDRARSGHSRLYHALAIDRSGASAGEEYDVVTEASEESFPASDAPSWTPTGTPGSPKH